jgi:hypothetical protein
MGPIYPRSDEFKSGKHWGSAVFYWEYEQRNFSVWGDSGKIHGRE